MFESWVYAIILRILQVIKHSENVAPNMNDISRSLADAIERGGGMRGSALGVNRYPHQTTAQYANATAEYATASAQGGQMYGANTGPPIAYATEAFPQNGGVSVAGGTDSNKNVPTATAVRADRWGGLD